MSLTLLVVAVVVLVIEPGARPLMLVVSFLLLAAALTGLAEFLRLGSGARARVGGAAFLLLGIGFAAGAAVAWADPAALPEPAFPRPGPTGQVVMGLIGALVFGGTGAIALIRGGRPPR